MFASNDLSVVVHVGLAMVLLLSPLTAHVESQLRHPSDSNRQDDHGSTESREEQGHRDRDASAGGEELDPYVTGVLGDEVNQRDTKKDGHADRDPRGRCSGVTKTIGPALFFIAMVATVIVLRRGGRGDHLVLRIVRAQVAHASPVTVPAAVHSLVEVMGFEPTASTLRT